MEPTWDDWRLFLAAWQTGSLSGAASRLGLGQATLSRRIAALEVQVGHVLFDRTRRGLAPTEAALALVPHAEAMEAAALAAEATVQGLELEAAGVVRLAAPEGLAVDLVPALLPELSRRHPKVRLEVLTGNRLYDLSRREADLALRGHRSDGDVVARRLPDPAMGLFVAPSLLARLPSPLRVEDLPMVTWVDDFGQLPMAEWVAGLLGGRPAVLTSNSFLVLRAAAVAGQGAMALPAFQARVAGLVPVPLELPPHPEVPWYLVVPRPLRRVPRVAAVVALLDETIRAGF